MSPNLLTTPFAALAFGVLLTLTVPAATGAADQPWLTIPGGNGPGKGKTVVLIAGDEEYRSEEVLPEFARILAHRHGFNCIVLFAQDPKDGTINPNVNDNIPGLENLAKADLVVMFIRWRNLPDDQMRRMVEYIESGRPIFGIRTSTHAFKLSSPTFAKYTWDSKEPGWEGGFGRRVFGETWYTHHGAHRKEGTRGVVAPGQEQNRIVRGIRPGTIFGKTDVYGVHLPLPGDSTPVVLGEVTETMEPDSAPVAAKNNPMMPIAWTRTYTGAAGKPARVFASTIGAATDFAYEGTRRLLVNGVYWALGLEKEIPPVNNVEFVRPFPASMYGERKSEEYQPGIRPSDLPR